MRHALGEVPPLVHSEFRQLCRVRELTVLHQLLLELHVLIAEADDGGLRRGEGCAGGVLMPGPFDWRVREEETEGRTGGISFSGQ